MNLPFTADEFLAVFAQYNAAVWPAQGFAYGLGLLAVGLAITPTKWGNRIIAAALALMWLWTGIFYHILNFAPINTIAYAFGAGFIAQGILLAIFGVFKHDLKFRLKLDSYGIVGLIFVMYSMLMYPLVGPMLGHAYPHAPVFGIAPCPVGIFTFGMLLMAEPSVPRAVMLLPFVWSLIGALAAIRLGMIEDFGLLVAGIVGSLLILQHERALTVQRLEGGKGKAKGKSKPNAKSQR